MDSAVLVDTNVWVYRFDPRDAAKCAWASAVLDALSTARVQLVVSGQVLSEFANVFTGRLAHIRPDPLDAALADVAAEVALVHVTLSTVQQAVNGAARFGFSFYDAQIWAAAEESGATVVLSEDFTDGLVADGVRFVNPFAPGFRVDEFIAELARP